jgi:outer membrane protein OmpA-like peptidoglycan-associated protein
VTAELIDKGMRLEGRVAVYGILFETGKSEIQAESRPALDEMAAYIAANPETRFLIVGHTDATGSFDGNLELSRHRAAAVVRALVSEHAVPAEQLTAHGVGPLCPVAPNTDASGRARNRRVEIVER